VPSLLIDFSSGDEKIRMVFAKQSDIKRRMLFLIVSKKVEVKNDTLVIILSYISSATTVTQEGWLMTFDEYKGGYFSFLLNALRRTCYNSSWKGEGGKGRLTWDEEGMGRMVYILCRIVVKGGCLPCLLLLRSIYYMTTVCCLIA